MQSQEASTAPVTGSPGSRSAEISFAISVAGLRHLMAAFITAAMGLPPEAARNVGPAPTRTLQDRILGAFDGAGKLANEIAGLERHA